LDICEQLVVGCGSEGYHCMERIAVGYETWIHHYEPDCKHPHSPTKKKFKTHLTAGRLMLFSFLGLTTATTGTLSRERFYSEMQCDEIKPAI